VPHLPQVRQALHRLGLLARAVQRRQQNRDQQRNNANDHQQFDQRESPNAGATIQPS
jgi:hypothetical protein